MFRVPALILFLSLTMGIGAWAQIPQTMSYQGVLTDIEGNRLEDGTVSLTFRLYDARTEGTPLWEETQKAEVSDGLFSAILGSTNPLNLAFDRPYWLGISVGADGELAPRIALTASPYSLNAVSRIAEPEAGQSFTIRDAGGKATHVLSQDGDVVHKGKGIFEGGIRITAPSDTSLVIVNPGGPGLVIISGDTTEVEAFKRAKISGTDYEAREEALLVRVGKGTALAGKSDSGSGVYGFSRVSSGVWGNSQSGNGVLGKSDSGSGVYGFSRVSSGVWGDSQSGSGVYGFSRVSSGVWGNSQSGNGVLAVSEEGIGLVAEGGNGAAEFKGDVRIDNSGKLKIDQVPPDPGQERFLVWGDDKYVRYRTLPEGGEQSPWTVDEAGSLVGPEGSDVKVRGEINAQSLHIVNTKGDTLISFNADGTSYHKKKETFAEGLETPLVESNIMVVYPELGLMISDNVSGEQLSQLDPFGGVTAIYVLAEILEVIGDKLLRMDHPLDPAHKYLVHSSIESSERLNVYSGNVVTDEKGYATVTLPLWFEAFNQDLRYQLTVIGQFAQAIIAKKVQDNQFVIQTDQPNVEVSWQVTGVRHDAWAEQHPLDPEQDKVGDDRGRYLYPEGFGAATSQRIGAAQKRPSILSR